MKILKVGVYHHDCWGSFSTKNHPTISMTEMGAIRIVKKSAKGVLVDVFLKIKGENQNDLTNYLDYLQTLDAIKELKIYHRQQNEACVFIRFLSSTSSYDKVLSTGAVPIGPVVQEKEMEIHTLATQEPKQNINLLNELEQLGEVKVFKVADFNENKILGLTNRQTEALIHAFNNNYYDWPRKANLDLLSKKLGIKRRTYQERLRQAETKLIPYAIQKIIKERKVY